MKILTKGIRSISRKGSSLILTYDKGEQAAKAMNQICEENEGLYSENFPHGVFQDGELKEYGRPPFPKMKF